MKPKILLVEDDLLTIEFYKDVFQMAGFDLEVFDWGHKALERLKEIREGKKEKPDLILLDFILPDIHPALIVEEARKYPKTKDLLIFGLTNFTDLELDKVMIESGIDRILVKTDYTPKELIALIKEALGLK